MGVYFVPSDSFLWVGKDPKVASVLEASWGLPDHLYVWVSLLPPTLQHIHCAC